MNLTDFFNNYEFIKKLQNHLTVSKENLLNDFPNNNIEKSFNQLLLSPSNAYLSKKIISQTFADMTWKFNLLEGQQTLTSPSPREFTLTYESQTSRSIFYYETPISGSCYVECNFVDVEPGTTNCIFLGNAENIASKTFLAIQTFPLSSFRGDKIGEGWVAIMEFDNSNIHNPNVLTWSYDIEPTGVFRLSKNTSTLKLHHNRTYSLGAKTTFIGEDLHAGFFSYAFASSKIKKTTFKNLSCGNY